MEEAITQGVKEYFQLCLFLAGELATVLKVLRPFLSCQDLLLRRSFPNSFLQLEYTFSNYEAKSDRESFGLEILEFLKDAGERDPWFSRFMRRSECPLLFSLRMPQRRYVERRGESF